VGFTEEQRAGSFCSAPPGVERITTIGAQKATNTLLATPDEDTFVQRLLASLGSYPAYFDRLAQANRRGPALLPATVGLAPLPAAMVRSLLAQGGQLVDVRPVTEFAAGHIPGARHAELGTLPQRPEAAPKGAVVMCGHGERAMTGASLLARGGVDDLAVLAGGPADWATVTGRLLEKGP
jgi:rhodanese-related sulfurtransferase